jgi:hypothetical protein
MAGVNVKMGVSGVQQFKQAMKESQAAVKTLDAELKLNEQQLRSNGDQQQYMEQKTKLLQEQIKKQTEVVNQAQKALEAMSKNGVKESSTAFQNMKQQSLAAQTQLSAMQAELENVGAAGEQAANDLSGIGSQLNSIKMNASWENIASGVEKITEKMEAAGRAAWNMGKKIVQATLSGGQWADDLATTATQWQMDPEDVYRMQQTANLIDTSAETIFQSRQKLLKAMGGEDDKAAMGAFAALGISDLRGTKENIEDVFWTAGEGLMQMEDKVAQNEYAMKLFGRSWSEMIPIFQAGRKAYEETYNSWTWMGDEQFNKLGQMNDEQMELQTEWENFQHQFEASLAPALTEVMTILNNLMHEFNTYLTSDEGQEMLKSLGETVSGMFEDLKTIKPEEIMEKIKEALDAIKDGLNWLIENKDSVKTALTVIAGGFGLLKLGSLAANIGKVISGLKGVLPGTGAASGKTGASGGSGGLSGFLNNAVTGAGTSHVLGEASALTRNARVFENGMNADSIAAWVDAQIASGFIAPGDREKYLQQNLKLLDFQSQTHRANLEGTGELIYKDRTPNRMGGDYFGVPEHLTKMARVAEESTEATTKATASSDKMTAAAETLSQMPAEMYAVVENAIRTGMAGVTIVINESAVDTIGRRMSGGMGTSLMNLLN